jgi:ferric-dicitrate binding protein FerR (iron transport regulator)
MKVGASMESESHRDILDENLKKLLGAARQEDSGFQAHLWDVVREEVRKERSAIWKRRVFRSLSAATGVAAVLAIVWSLVGLRAESVGQFQPLYGVAEVVDGGGSRTIVSGEPILAGCSIRTLSGSRAAILLRDGSRLTLAPRTTVQMAGGKRGPVVELTTGAVDVEAAKQHSGKKLVIETPGSRITTLGTVFTVQLSTKPDGTRKTRVGVTSGLVEFESGGQTVRLPARTEGLAEEGQSPEKRLVSFELNELLQLIRKNGELAARLNKREGSPAIIQCKDGSTAAIWTVIGFEDLRETGKGERTLRLKSPASKARLFTLDGREIPVEAQGRDLQVDASALDSGASQDTRLILELQDVKGVFRTDGGITWLRLPPGTSDAVTLLQFHLPDGAKIERISPEPVERTRVLNRLAVTVAGEIEGLGVFE